MNNFLELLDISKGKKLNVYVSKTSIVERYGDDKLLILMRDIIELKVDFLSLSVLENYFLAREVLHYYKLYCPNCEKIDMNFLVNDVKESLEIFIGNTDSSSESIKIKLSYED